jgi:hypothetical protein
LCRGLHVKAIHIGGNIDRWRLWLRGKVDGGCLNSVIQLLARLLAQPATDLAVLAKVFAAVLSRLHMLQTVLLKNGDILILKKIFKFV